MKNGKRKKNATLLGTNNLRFDEHEITHEHTAISQLSLVLLQRLDFQTRFILLDSPETHRVSLSLRLRHHNQSYPGSPSSTVYPVFLRGRRQISFLPQVPCNHQHLSESRANLCAHTINSVATSAEPLHSHVKQHHRIRQSIQA